VGGQEVAIVSIQYNGRQLQISNRENFNFVHNFPKMEISAPNFVF